MPALAISRMWRHTPPSPQFSPQRFCEPFNTSPMLIVDRPNSASSSSISYLAQHGTSVCSYRRHTSPVTMPSIPRPSSLPSVPRSTRSPRSPLSTRICSVLVGSTTTASAMCELGLSWAAVGQENAQLEARGAASEGKADAAASTVLAAKTAEFRETLSAILGVKVAFYDNGQVRITSQDDLGTVFVFQPAPRDPATKDGAGGSSRNSGAARMQLVVQGEGVPQELPHLMRNWVEIEQSIPCFLASVTEARRA